VSELPQNWTIVSIEDVITLNPRNDCDDSIEVGFVPLQLLGVRFRDHHTFEQRSWSEVKKGYSHFADGDVLLARITPSFENGKAGIARDLPNGLGAGSTEYFVCRPLVGAIVPEYLLAYFKTTRFLLDGEHLMTGASGHKRVPKRYLLKSKLPLAPFNEQKRIVDKLDALFAQVDACRNRLDRASSILDRFRQTILDLAISGKLTDEWREVNSSRLNNTFQSIQPELTGDYSNVINLADYEIPISWTWLTPELIKFPEQHSLSIGPFGSNLTVKDYKRSGTPVVFVRDIRAKKFGGETTKFVSEEKAQQLWAHRVEPGDLLITKMGDPPGDVAVFPPDQPISIITADCIRIKTDPKIVDIKLLSLFIESSLVKSLVKEMTAGVAQQKISLHKFRAMPLPIPPLDEQQEILRRVESLFASADRLKERYRNAYSYLEQLVPALLDKAFRGELVPQDPNDEPASVLLERIQLERNRMESDQKATRTARRSAKKEVSKASAKQSMDYLEALRTAFEALGSRADARQLFEQAGFDPADAVQFYETLRAIPEVRDAFRKSVQERPPQKQSAAIKDKFLSENGHFRLVELWLEEFKNLADYTVRFDSSHSIDIVLGWNGTGKSNLFEALVIIFRDLHRWSEKNQWTQKPMKGYRLRYEINGGTVEVAWKPEEMKRPKLRMETPQEDEREPVKLETITRTELPLPRFIFGYYSGPTNRLAEHFLPMKQDHYDRLLKATSDDPETLNNLLEQRRFFCAENHHAKYVLLAFCHREDDDIKQFLEDRLRIVGFESALFIIRKPRWAKKGQTAENFWGATGIMRRVMERLRQFAIAPMVLEQTVPDGFRSSREDHYYFFLPDLQSLHAFAAEYEDARTFFLALESTDFSELIYDVKIQVRVKATKTEQVAITFHELSEGEQQLLMVLGLMRFTKSHQSLVLLDEPDTHLNPHWSVDYLKLLARVMGEGSGEAEEQLTSQILMSTHDPLVIASLFKEQIHLLKRDWQTGACKWDQPDVDPRGLGFTGILTSEMFGMRSDLDEETLADLDNKVRLVAQDGSLTPEEARELEEINKRLEDAGFQKAFSDPYYAAFVRAWGRRHSDLMAGVQFLSQEQHEEIDRIAREVLEEAIAELQAEAVS
jgi:predicted ATPase